MKKVILGVAAGALVFSSCCDKKKCNLADDAVVNGYARVELKSDLSRFSDQDRKMMAYLCDAAEVMEDIYWKEAFPGDRNEFLNSIQDKTLRKFAEINYGPWDRLDGNIAFMPVPGAKDGMNDKPRGACFYPADMTIGEFEAWNDPDKDSHYTMIVRDENGKLKAVWYHDYFKEDIERAAALLDSAAALASDEGFKKYLSLRARALRTDDYFESDLAWMDAKSSDIDFVVGPIEDYEDDLFGYKSAHESFLLVKDPEWSARLSKFADMLPQLQRELPVDPKYKSEMPGTDSDLNVYDVLLYRGDGNAGGKTIAINLPNDERVHIQKGTRKLQLKNAMKAKFDNIVIPIADIVMNPEQRKMVDFDCFFEDVTFHEVAHGLGVKNTINGKGTVRSALKETYSAIEEAKADIMGLYMVDQLYQKGEMSGSDVDKNYITFFAGIFRSVRFGAASAHGKANMLCFNFMKDHDVFTRDAEGKYTVDLPKMKEATKALMAQILKYQAEGDYEGVRQWMAEKSVVPADLQEDLDRIAEANIAKDIYFVQGKSVLGL
ncbi:MAG: Zn-dependent hydrolase [Bacteroides sp.]|nr:Zn-dependent hydrolase [Bacteroides sp.]MCM1085136.1 Zn-dependent hydrolase [Bacteroides sp.]